MNLAVHAPKTLRLVCASLTSCETDRYDFVFPCFVRYQSFFAAAGTKTACEIISVGQKNAHYYIFW